MWRCARNSQGEKAERTSQLGKYKRYPLCNQRKSEARHGTTAIPNPTYSSWSWAFCRSQSSFSNLSAGPDRNFRDLDSGQMSKRMELLNKYIEADPHGALFGRRLDPSNNFGTYDASWNDFLQSLTTTTTKKSTEPKPIGADKWQPTRNPNHVGLQYDPVSGRMTPIAPFTKSITGKAERKSSSRTVVGYPLGTEVEAKFASKPTLTEHGQFQPGSTKLNPEAPSGSQSAVDCPPGSELETLFTSTSLTNQDMCAKTQMPQEPERKPNMNIDCSPGSELESLFVSESSPSTQPRLDTSKVNETTNALNVDAGLAASTNVECSPGNELEAKFSSDPVSRSVQSSSSGMETQCSDKQADFLVHCPPGNELDVELSSKLAGIRCNPDDSIHQNTNEATQKGPLESLEYSPRSKTEGQTLLESASQNGSQPGAQVPVDCSPGSEIEAKFVSSKAEAEERQSQSAVPPSLDNLPKANITVDCTPGDELEAKFVSDRESAKCLSENENLGTSNADEICSRDLSLESEAAVRPLDFDASEDRVGDAIFHQQNLASEHELQSSISKESTPQFHILAFDTSTSQVSAVQADLFFGADENLPPSQVLSRLHNPSKFIPYFEKMQLDGYEIATGGGNILVFRKIQNNLRESLPPNPPANQDPAIHAEIARYLRHDTIDSASFYSAASKPSTTEPPPATGSSNFEPGATRTSESSFRKVGPRILMAGTMTAATCYAIGVVTEFFRTGGQDGHGIDGFTAFESDRRHRE
ncbi:hypothetical protein N7475_003285 [Penicillium sp. IBT 31633x]|nr:hypothetical protein N7475_003285 [Penicillium sp. IBT 31633x]